MNVHNGLWENSPARSIASTAAGVLTANVHEFFLFRLVAEKAKCSKFP